MKLENAETTMNSSHAEHGNPKVAAVVQKRQEFLIHPGQRPDAQYYMQ